MKFKQFLFTLALFTAFTGAVSAGQLLSESFESYKLGRLDVNDPTGPNTNSSNPWAGPFAAGFNNCFVVGTETSNGILIAPHSGTNMVRGDGTANDFDQDYYNLSFWQNQGNAFSNNIYLDWWFFDQIGKGTNSANPAGYSDFIALAYYPGIPSNTSYDPNLANDYTLGNPTTRLSIGGVPSSNQEGTFVPTNFHSGFSRTNYQALVLNNATNGYDSAGFANLPTGRSVGWHHARIEISARDTNSNNTAKFFVDDLTNAAMTAIVAAPNGFNCIELNAEFGTTTAYYDDITFGTLVTAPSTLSISTVGTNCIVTWAGTHILQSATVLYNTNFTDVLSGTNFVTSPYTNTVSGTSRFFRLRN